MKNTNPLVSIIIPVYNTEKFVKEAIDSALGQTYHNIEVIAVDDGSTDCSLEIMKNINEPRFRYYSQMNQGACVARNRGIQESKGEYFKFLDADDILYPDCIEKHIIHYQSLNNNEISIGKVVVASKNGSRTIVTYEEANTSDNSFVSINEAPHIWTAAPLYQKHQLLSVGGFDVKLSFGQEMILNAMMDMKEYKFRYADFFTFMYRSRYNLSNITDRKRDFATAIHIYHLLATSDSEIISNDYLAKYCINMASSTYTTPLKRDSNYFYHLARKHNKHVFQLPRFRNSRLLGILTWYISYIIPYAYTRLLFSIKK